MSDKDVLEYCVTNVYPLNLHSKILRLGPGSYVNRSVREDHRIVNKVDIKDNCSELLVPRHRYSLVPVTRDFLT